jgi:predicted secreted protein
MKILKLLFVLLALSGLASGVRAELQDQGLKSIMDIIDKAISQLDQQPGTADSTAAETDPAELEKATSTVVNLSRTLGTLSYSRLQCGQAEVLSEFTQRVQLMPEASRDPMRDAFQEGFDKSKEETPLLSADECERLTRSRQRSESVDQANVQQEKPKAAAVENKPAAEQVEEPVPAEDPKLRQLRIAELSGQLAYKRRFCQDEKVFNRDYNEYLQSVPEEYREEVKAAYWKGFKHGKSLNKNLTAAQCAS